MRPTGRADQCPQLQTQMRTSPGLFMTQFGNTAIRGTGLAMLMLTFEVSPCYLSEQLQARRSHHMSEHRVDRRLAAIFAGDIAGYSRLMGADEEGTLRQLKAHRKELVDPKITEHRGRVVKTTGDGMLVEFVSVVDAVRCAVDVQRGMAERNANVATDRRIEFRIGINVGDIISDENDIYGDGVNVAARLEALAEPGGILVSRNVHDQV